ncbi:MAG: hypothetical protein KDD51_12850 [Bdellovibrionales bacterium]|nr:hypothetical protein [Bdellovibrionales bacterium]
MAALMALACTNLLMVVLTTWAFFGLVSRSAWGAILVGSLLALVGALALSRTAIKPRIPRQTPVLFAVLNGLAWATLSAAALFVQNWGNAAGLAIAVPMLFGAEFLFGAVFFLGLRAGTRSSRG